MSVEVVTAVLKHSNARLAARLVLLVLADAASPDGISWVGQDEIGARALVSVQEVRRSLRDLERDGEIELRKVQRGRKRINVYRVIVGDVCDVEPRYDRLPFALPEPFATTAQSVRSPMDDDRASSAATTELLRRPTRARQQGLEPLGEPLQVANATSGESSTEPPPLARIDGRNPALDALCAATGVDPASPRFPQAIVALNGRLHKTTGKLLEPGIRHLFWIECVRWAEENDALDRLDLAYAEPAEWTASLVRRIEQKAQQYAAVYPGAALSPTALRNHWLDLDRAPQRATPGLSAAEMEQFA